MVDELAIEAVGLAKSYRDVRVLDGVDLRIPRGTVFCLLGPNGAGKTTSVRILATLLRPDRGQARVAGFDVIRERRQVRHSISLTGQHTAVDEQQTGRENLRMMARLYGLSRAEARRAADRLLAQFDLTEAGGRRVATYSGGMRRRLDLAVGLVGQPSVIFLDEPTTGLDLRSRQAMWRVINDLAGAGVTIFLTTQYLEEADQLASRIGVLDGGRLAAEGTPSELKKQVADQRLELTAADAEDYATLASVVGEHAIRAEANRLTVAVGTDGTAANVRDLLEEFDPDRRLIQKFGLRTATLDDVFLALTGHATTRTQEEIISV